jgi:hypothetical protein
MKLRKYSVSFEGLEVWTVEPLLKIVEHLASQTCLEVTNISCDLKIELEGFDGKLDFDVFKAELNDRHSYFGVLGELRREKDDADEH